MNKDLGKLIMLMGAGIVILGLLVFFFHNKLHWLGRLPGDIRIEKPGFRFYFPITTMILLSAVLSLILYIVRKL